jgi:Ca-activated chloride channel family protein
MAQVYKIKVYTIGIGSEREIEEVIDSPLGPITQKKKLEFNEALLQTLARQTGGQYFHPTDKDALQKIYASINQLEKSKVEVTAYNRFTDEYFLPLMIGIVLIVLEMILRYTVFRKFP